MCNFKKLDFKVGLSWMDWIKLCDQDDHFVRLEPPFPIGTDVSKSTLKPTKLVKVRAGTCQGRDSVCNFAHRIPFRLQTGVVVECAGPPLQQRYKKNRKKKNQQG